MRVCVLGSGSKGNCVALVTSGGIFLVDIGLSCLQVSKRLEEMKLPVKEVKGIFFTHDHIDHYNGLKTFHKRHPKVTFYANGNTADAIATDTGVEEGWCIFETAIPFAVDSLLVQTFSIPHDAAEPVGYLFTEGDKSLFVGTDMGYVTSDTKDALSKAVCAIFESNHDPSYLERSERPFDLKQRIAGPSGHLSNEQAADVIRELNPPKLRHLLLAHLSQECNAPWIAEECMKKALSELGRTDIKLSVLEQDNPSEIVEF